MLGSRVLHCCLVSCFVAIACSGCDPDRRQTVKPNSSVSGSIPIKVLAWNIESEGADINVIAAQLIEMPRYDIYGFTEVNRDEWPAIQQALGDGYTYWYSYSGFKDRTAFAFNHDRFERLKKYEMKEYKEFTLNPRTYRSPHVHEFHDRQTGADFIVLLNHLARGNKEIRLEQAEGLRHWASDQKKPVIAIGDYNFDYVFATQAGNAAFDRFMLDGVFRWVKPEPLEDSNWFDGDGDGKDDFPGSILDFCFVAGEAKLWNATSRVIVRDGDFPDDETTSDHRPIELIFAP